MPFQANVLLVARNVVNNGVILSTLFGTVVSFLAGDAGEQGFSFSATSTHQLDELGLGFLTDHHVLGLFTHQILTEIYLGSVNFNGSEAWKTDIF